MLTHLWLTLESLLLLAISEDGDEGDYGIWGALGAILENTRWLGQRWLLGEHLWLSLPKMA